MEAAMARPGAGAGGAVKRGGVVLRDGETLRFLPATVVVRIVPCPPISRVPGAPKPLLGITHAGGEVVPVVAVGKRQDVPLVVCRYLGESVGLLGCEVIGSGVYDAHSDIEGAVIVGGVTAHALDLGATFASLQGARWALRFGG
jgi:hypothetical protein